MERGSFFNCYVPAATALVLVNGAGFVSDATGYYLDYTFMRNVLLPDTLTIIIV